MQSKTTISKFLRRNLKRAIKLGDFILIAKKMSIESEETKENLESKVTLLCESELFLQNETLPNDGIEKCDTTMITAKSMKKIKAFGVSHLI